MSRHVDPASTEADSFRFQAKALLDGGITAQLDCTTSA
jgi:hypothetical protein